MSTPTNGTPTPNDPQDNGDLGKDATSGDHSPSTSDGNYSAPQFGGAASTNAPGPQGRQGSDAPRDQSGSSAPQFRPAGGQDWQQQPAQGGGYGGPGGMQNQNPYQSGGQNAYGSGKGFQPQGDRKSIKGTPPLWLGITLAVLGPVLGLIMIIVSFVTLGGTVTDFANAPSGSTQSLEADTDYWIMSGDGTTFVSSCSVYDPESNSIDVDVTPSSSASTETQDSSMNLVGTFTSQDAGDYSVYCSDLAGSDTYVVEGNIGGILGGAAGIIGGILLGLLLLVIGIVLIIINRVTASRRRRAAGFN